MTQDIPSTSPGLSPQDRPAAKKPARTRVRKVAVEFPSAAAADPVATIAKDEIMEEQIKTATDRTQAMFTAAGDQAKTAADRGVRLFEELGEFNKGNVEALVESGRIAAHGLESLGQDAAAYAKRSYETGIAAIRTLSTVKNPAEFLKVQSDLVRQSFDALVSEGSRGAEATLKLAGEVVQPLQNRWALAAEKVRVVA